MKSSIIKTGTMLAGFLLAACLSTHAEVKLPAIFSDGMVMQQQTNANLWGTATPHKKVTVTTSWNGKQYADGHPRLRVEPRNRYPLHLAGDRRPFRRELRPP